MLDIGPIVLIQKEIVMELSVLKTGKKICVKCNADIVAPNVIGKAVWNGEDAVFCSDCAINTYIPSNDVVYSSPCGCEDYPCCGH